MASGLLEPALFNKENNALILEEQRLQEEKRKIMTSVSGDRTKVEALEKLIKEVSGGEMLTEFSDEVFLAHVNGITVLSREEIANLSRGVCTSNMVGPMEIQSKPDIFEESVPHSNPAWMVAICGSALYKDLYASDAIFLSLESGLYSQAG